MFESKISTKAKRATSSDVFNIIQKRPNTVVHLKVDEALSHHMIFRFHPSYRTSPLRIISSLLPVVPTNTHGKEIIAM